MAATPYLRMTGIAKSFPGVQALKNVNLEAYPGEAIALIGANGAGKSTLMNVLGGVITKDEGTIEVDGQAIELHSPADATSNGIAFVHQEISVLATLSVVDNMFISQYPTRSNLIDYGAAVETCRKVLARLGSELDPTALVRNLSPGEQQLVEIGRALLGNPRIVIFDEPTSSLTGREKQRLFEVIRALKSDGVTVIYITHFLDEVFEICERAVVLRNGETVGNGLIADLTYQDIVRLMIGETDLDASSDRVSAEPGDVVLRVQGLERRGVLRDISFELRSGEVVGLWGLLGSGRTELARTIVGLDPLDTGEILLRHSEETSLSPMKPNEAKAYIGMVTENRRDEGLLLRLSVRENMSLASLRSLVSAWPIVNKKKESEVADQLVDRLKIKITNLEQPVSTLSGGNQQKVVVGRWLQRNPVIYIMDEPTRGLDIGAKAEIRNEIERLANAGAAILLISSDIDEILSLSDRYLVVNHGQIVDKLPGDATKMQLMTSATAG